MDREQLNARIRYMLDAEKAHWTAASDDDDSEALRKRAHSCILLQELLKQAEATRIVTPQIV